MHHGGEDDGVNEFEKDRSQLSGLHFAQDSMRPHERETLHLAERMLARLDAVLELHSPDPSGWKPGTSTDYMSCYGCRLTTLGGGATRLWKNCPTRRAVLGDPA